MIPFSQHISNQPSSVPPGVSDPQQVPGGSSNSLPNPMQIHSQMGFPNSQIPNFNGLNGHLVNSILGLAPSIPQQVQSLHGGFGPPNYGHNLNASGFNGQLGNLARNLNQGNPAQFFGHNPLNASQNFNQAANFQNGQIGWQNQVQNMNQLGNMPFLNPSQVAALAQLMGCANQVAQAMVPQNTAFIGNPNPGLVRPNGVLNHTNFGQQIQSVALTASNPTSSHSQPSQSPGLLGNHGKQHGMHVSNSVHHKNKNFTKNPRREAANGRFQKSQNHHMHNKSSGENGGKESNKNPGPDNSTNQPKSGKRRSLAMFYTEKEIQQWREERKKNYPSKANVEKKTIDRQENAAAIDEDAKLRRQQLKEVLAKQVELGFEVPEIPSHYLLDSENQFHGKNTNKRGRFQNRFNKRGRFDNDNNNNNNRFSANRGIENDGSFRKRERFGKRQRVEGDHSSNAPLNIRKPTLLQKLLSTDIKRDNMRLLQAFRFMVMNSFFKDWPEKPLNFPKVLIKEAGVESEVIEQKSPSSKGEVIGCREDHNDTSDDSDREKDECQEEGEITD